MRNEYIRLREHRELRMVWRDVNICGNLAKLRNVQALADRHDDLPLGVAEDFQALFEELRLFVVDGAQRDIQHRSLGAAYDRRVLRGLRPDRWPDKNIAIVEGFDGNLKCARH